jgi:RHS repeat-associated protein
MPGRNYQSSTAYRYGFNGKENDKETVGTGEGTQDYGLRIYNPALGKFLSVDPLTKQFPHYTPYQFAGNKPIQAVDLDGGEEKIVIWGRISDGTIHKTIKWSDVIPGQQYGPKGAGTDYYYIYDFKEKKAWFVKHETSLVEELKRIDYIQDHGNRAPVIVENQLSGDLTKDTDKKGKFSDLNGTTNPEIAKKGGGAGGYSAEYSQDFPCYDGRKSYKAAPGAGIDVYDGNDKVSIAKKENGDTADVYRHGKAQIPDGLPLGQHNTVPGTENWKEGVREANNGKKVIEK